MCQPNALTQLTATPTPSQFYDPDIQAQLWSVLLPHPPTPNLLPHPHPSFLDRTHCIQIPSLLNKTALHCIFQSLMETQCSVGCVETKPVVFIMVSMLVKDVRWGSVFVVQTHRRHLQNFQFKSIYCTCRTCSSNLKTAPGELCTCSAKKKAKKKHQHPRYICTPQAAYNWWWCGAWWCCGA